MRAEVCLNRTIPEKNGDTVKRIPIGKGSKQLLQYIEENKALGFQAEQELTREGKLVTAKSIRTGYLGEEGDPTPTLLKMYDEHNKRIEKLIGIDYSKETLTRHKTSRNHIARFINEQYGKEDIPINKIDHKFFG